MTSKKDDELKKSVFYSAWSLGGTELNKKQQLCMGSTSVAAKKQTNRTTNIYVKCYHHFCTAMLTVIGGA